jgi:hypothetical protein
MFEIGFHFLPVCRTILFYASWHCWNDKRMLPYIPSFLLLLLLRWESCKYFFLSGLAWNPNLPYFQVARITDVSHRHLVHRLFPSFILSSFPPTLSLSFPSFLLLFFFFSYLFLWGLELLCIPGWPWTHDLPTSASEELELQMCTTVTCLNYLLFHNMDVKTGRNGWKNWKWLTKGIGMCLNVRLAWKVQLRRSSCCCYFFHMSLIFWV